MPLWKCLIILKCGDFFVPRSWLAHPARSYSLIRRALLRFFSLFLFLFAVLSKYEILSLISLVHGCISSQQFFFRENIPLYVVLKFAFHALKSQATMMIEFFIRWSAYELQNQKQQLMKTSWIEGRLHLMRYKSALSYENTCWKILSFYREMVAFSCILAITYHFEGKKLKIWISQI